MNIFQQRRQKVFDHLKNNEMALVFANKPIRRSADAHYEFEANRNYYYLTGLNEPEGILMMAKVHDTPREYLFIRDINYDMEKWIGRFMTPAKSQEINHIQNQAFVSQFEAMFERLVNRSGIETLYLNLDCASLTDTTFEAERFLNRIQTSYRGLAIKNISPFIFRLRTIKDSVEISAIQEACGITDKALRRVLHNLKPGQYEYEAMAHFLFELNLNNATEMFDTIIASGANGPILHYVENQSQMRAGDLVLFDLGAKKNHYGADISRTYPVSGHYNDRQAQLYDIVSAAQDLVTSLAKPNTTLLELNQAVISFYEKELKKIGLIDKPEDVSKYYYHSISHFFGLDTHDVGQIDGMKLEPGMVISNEPGLYIKEENIGIRIETDLLITETGCKDLGDMIPKSRQEIEAIMAE